MPIIVSDIGHQTKPSDLQCRPHELEVNQPIGQTLRHSVNGVDCSIKPFIRIPTTIWFFCPYLQCLW
jgi:hypothetical protein